MALSLLTLGVISHFEPLDLGTTTRHCNFKASTKDTAHSFTSVSPAALYNATPYSVSEFNRTSPTPSTVYQAVSPTIMTVPNVSKLSAGLRFVSLAGLVLFVAAFSFGFGPGMLSISH